MKTSDIENTHKLLIESKKILNEKMHVPATKNWKTRGLISR